MDQRRVDVEAHQRDIDNWYADEFGARLLRSLFVAFLLAAAGIAILLGAGCSGSSGSEATSTCTFPTVLEQTPGGGDQLLLCGDGSILECSEGSCAFASGPGGDAASGNPNSGNTSDSGNPTDSNNRTTNVNPNPTPTPERGLGR